MSTETLQSRTVVDSLNKGGTARGLLEVFIQEHTGGKSLNTVTGGAYYQTSAAIEALASLVEHDCDPNLSSREVENLHTSLRGVGVGGRGLEVTTYLLALAAVQNTMKTNSTVNPDLMVKAFVSGAGI